MNADRFRKALERLPQSVPPIWLMRQAGRYHRHYQRLRREHGFMELCKDPRLAAEVAAGPVEDFDFDAAILFSDLLFPLEALGLELRYEESGPVLERRLDRDTLRRLAPLSEAVERLSFQKDAVAETRRRIPAEKALLGFVGGPWTLYVYAVEGTHKGDGAEAKKDSALFEGFCERLIPLLVENVRLQLEGGAEVVMVFDTAAGQIPPGCFRDRVVPRLESLAAAFPGKLGYYSRYTQPAHFRHPFFDSGLLAGVGVDAAWEMTEALGLFERGFVQGNFDQAALFLPPFDLEREILSYLEPLKRLGPDRCPGWVCGLGHGVSPGTPEENVRAFVRTVRQAFSC